MNAPAFWHRPSLLGYLLFPLSLLYWWIACLRTAKIEETILPVPVICVGNNTVGGSGKTPTVLAIATILQAQGKKPHVISRGYKGQFEGVLQVDAAQHTAEQVGDEPLLIAGRVPCWVARRRVDAALAAIAAGADCIIMDDGMQNPSIKKRVSVMVVDGGYGFGNRQMIPAGPCREPISVSLSKASMLLVMGEATHPNIRSIAALHPHVFHATLKPSEQVDLTGQKLLAFAGIGRPSKFFETLQAYGATLEDTASFPDHHTYRASELETLLANATHQEAALMTTEKDWLRLPEAWRAQVRYLPVQAELQEQPEFEALLLAAIGGAA